MHLNRALSKLGVLSRSQATAAILAGRVTVDGRVVRDPAASIDVGRARIRVGGEPARASAWRTVLFHKPRGVVTTSRDPEGRPTVYSRLDPNMRALVTVGRLDLATTGLLLLTSDTALSAWLTDPVNAVPRIYLATVRGRVTPEALEQLTNGVRAGGDRLAASAVTARKVSGRESHLTIELREGKNREVRRLCEAVGHEVTRLKRVAFGGLQLGDLPPGRWREVSRDELRAAFPAWGG